MVQLQSSQGISHDHMQVLGIGRTGHIGFNEPGSSLKSRTRLLMLNKVREPSADE